MSKVSKLFLTEGVKRAAEQFVSEPSHALMIVGSDGNGAPELALAISSELTAQASPSDTTSPNSLVIRPNKHGNISIEEVRDAWSFSRVASGDMNRTKKTVVILGAQSMTAEAQNSLLKLLEEPPVYMYFILVVPTVRSVLATIDSRVRKLNISPLSKDEFVSVITSELKTDKTEASNLYLATSGEIYKALSLKNNDAGGMQRAKEVVGMSSFERLSTAGKALSDRDEALSLVSDIFHLAYIGLNQAVANGKDGKQWLSLANLAGETNENLKANGNVKLNMTYLLTSM